MSQTDVAAPPPADGAAPTSPRSLCLLAVRNLPRMFLPEHRLF